jgi:SNF2 family DNA or RNA helicase
MGRLGQKVKYKLGLTGSPMPHSPLDAYAQYRFLDPTIFGTSFTRFRSRYAIMGGFQGHEIKGYQHEDELNEKFYSIAYRVGREAIELPEAIHETRTCVLEPSALKIYKELEHDCFTALREDTTITPANALTKLLRLQQVTSGVVKDDDGVLQEVSKAKGELLADIMEDLPTHEPVVVFARFQADLDTIRRVCEEQGRKYGELSGRARDGLTSDSTMSPDIDVIGVQIQSGGVGIDLTRAAYCIYLSLGYSLGDYEQSLARCHRPGQTRTTFFYHLITEGTVDEKVYKALDERRDVVESILKEVRG